MRRSNELCHSVCRVWGLAAVALILVGADDPKQTVDAGGLKFEAPKSWKLSPPPGGGMRRAQLKVEPIEGDDYPAELVVFAFGGGAGSVDDNLKRWQGLFKDKDGNPPSIDSKKVKGKNIEMTRAETHGDYHPARFPGRPVDPDRPNARLLGAIIMADGTSYYVRMIGPDKTMIKLRPVFDELLSSIQLEQK
jgi:hypothetical protein